MNDQLILTCNPDFTILAQRELSDATAVHNLVRLDAGVFLATVEESFWNLAVEWQDSPPIFIRHVAPVLETVPLSGDPADLRSLAQIARAEIAPLLEPGLAFSVQSRTFFSLAYKRFDINNAVSEAIQSASSAPLDVRNPIQIISVSCAEIPAEDQPEPRSVAFIGVSLASHNLSDWAGGMRRFAREDEQISRAEFKLLEALEVFGLDLPPNGVALDLGASPGGWTRVLRQRDQYVTAIDPGDLDPRLKGDRNVRHKRITAEKYLESEPDRFDMIVNDMRIDARDSARLMVAYARQLYRHGFAIMTLKLPEQGRETVIDHALNILKKGYIIDGARQLFHNRSEITVYLKPRPFKRDPASNEPTKRGK